MLFGKFHRWYDRLEEPSRTLTFFALMLVCLALPLMVTLLFETGQTVYQILQVVGWLVMMALGLDRAAWLGRGR